MQKAVSHATSSQHASWTIRSKLKTLACSSDRKTYKGTKASIIPSLQSPCMTRREGQCALLSRSQGQECSPQERAFTWLWKAESLILRRCRIWRNTRICQREVCTGREKKKHVVEPIVWRAKKCRDHEPRALMRHATDTTPLLCTLRLRSALQLGIHRWNARLTCLSVRHCSPSSVRR